jgi:hypothetical protein
MGSVDGAMPDRLYRRGIFKPVCSAGEQGKAHAAAVYENHEQMQEIS